MMKILVVDDNPVNQKLLTEMLGQFGCCDTAMDGVTAVEMFQKSIKEKSVYTLVCLDIMIPGLDGQQVLQKIRELEEEGSWKSKVIMCTSLDDSENIMEAFTKGQCDAYITKPVSREKLEYHLQQVGLIK